MPSVLLILILIIGLIALYFAARQRAITVCYGGAVRRRYHSLPFYYGVLAALWAGIPALIILSLWLAFEQPLIEYLVIRQLPLDVLAQGSDQLRLVVDQIENIANGYPIGFSADFMLSSAHKMVQLQTFSLGVKITLSLLAMALGAALIWSKIGHDLRARMQVEQWFTGALLGCSMVVLVIALGIVTSVVFEALRFFSAIDVVEFFTGTQWAPSAVRSGIDSPVGYFGSIPLFVGTILVAVVALTIALPTGLLSAIYLVEYASPRVRQWIQPLLSVLGGIPTVVYGFFAALTVAPFIHRLALNLGIEDASTESALAAGLVVGLMIIPHVTSMTVDVLAAVPKGIRDGALSLGSTPAEMIFSIVIPAAYPGIIACVLFAVARAIGETMVALMALGLLAKLSINPLASVSTVTKQIVALLEGEYGFDSPETLAAFALGMLLLVITVLLNYTAFRVLHRYRGADEHYYPN